MKTAISVPDPIFEAAERLARRLGMSRSQLYATALARFLDTFDEKATTEVLNEVYAETSSAIDATLLQIQLQSLPAEEW
ncbi:MAG: hypothetical protein H6650_16835 [Ardenticatenales bacterium]|nr:hypothetical protein [Ardenticatenales bacterium]